MKKTKIVISYSAFFVSCILFFGYYIINRDLYFGNDHGWNLGPLVFYFFYLIFSVFIGLVISKDAKPKILFQIYFFMGIISSAIFSYGKFDIGAILYAGIITYISFLLFKLKIFLFKDINK